MVSSCATFYTNRYHIKGVHSLYVLDSIDEDLERAIYNGFAQTLVRCGNGGRSRKYAMHWVGIWVGLLKACGGVGADK